MPHKKPAQQVRLALTEEGLALTARFKRDHIRNAGLNLSVTEDHSQGINVATDRMAISQLVRALMAEPSSLTGDATRSLPTYPDISELRLTNLNQIAAALISSPEVKFGIKHIAGGTELSCVIDAALEKSMPTVLRLQLAVHRSRLKLLARTAMLTPAEAVKALGKMPATAARSMKQLVASRKIFQIVTAEGVRYPQFQFRTARQDLQPVIERLLDVRMNRESDMHLLGFLMSAHSALTDRGQELGCDALAAYPASLIGFDDEQLVALYRDFFLTEGVD